MQLLTQSALLQALGWSLFNSLWQMGLLWLSYQLFILIFNKVSPRIRHGLVLLLLAAGALWSVAGVISTGLMIGGTAGGGDTGSGPLLVEFSPAVSPIRSFIAALIPYGSSLYLLILGGLLVRYCYHYFHSIKLRNTGLSRIQPVYRVFVEETSRRMSILPSVRVWLSSLVEVPVTLGFLKPVILLPLAMVSNLTAAQVEAVLVHELAHIRRKDFLINMGVTILEGLFFFNPFTRWMIADLKKEREHCCDDLVLQFRYDPHAYVTALLSLAKQCQQVKLVVAATGSGNNQLLLQRAKRILQQQRIGDRPGARPFALLVLTVLITLVTLSRPARIVPVAPLAGYVRSGVPRIADAEGANRLVSNAAPSIPTRPVRPARVPKPRPAMIDADDASDEDPTPMPILNAVADADWVAQKEMVIVAPKDSRAYSIGKSKSAVPTPAKEDGQPFIPKSSFTVQLIEEDTLRPEEKLARQQVQTQREIALTMQKLQLDLLAQLQLIKARQAELNSRTAEGPDQETLKLQQQLIEQQLRLQKQYLQQLDGLQKQLKKVQRHLTIVYV